MWNVEGNHVVNRQQVSGGRRRHGPSSAPLACLMRALGRKKVLWDPPPIAMPIGLKGALAVKIAVMGSGGVGGYFGAKLAKGGADVTFVARGAHFAAMRTHGLVVEGGPDDIRLPSVHVIEDPAAAGTVDLVMFAVKLWDTESAIAQIKPIVGPQTTVISFQNGVLKDEYLTRAFGPDRIMGGVCYVATAIARPGVIERTGALERMVFGEFDGVASPRAKRFLDACLAGGIKAELSGDIRREIWEKFVFLVGLSGTTTATRSTIGPIRENPQTRAFLLDVMREVVAVGRARGVDLPEDYAEQRLRLVDELAPDTTSSMYRDLEHGNRLEVRWLSGGVVELGRAVGVPAPLNRAIADILALRAEVRTRPQ
jgi:2-dehydropantoate 2-reductase